MELSRWDGDVLVAPDGTGRMMQPSGTPTIFSLSILDSRTMMGRDYKNQGNPLFFLRKKVLQFYLWKSYV